MKKRIVTAMLSAVMAFSLVACGSSDSDEAAKSEKTAKKDEVNPDDYVKLCNLEELEIVVDKYTFTDADVETELRSDFEDYVDTLDAYDYQDITDRTEVQMGDVCNIDYEGIRDGEAFEGGTDQDFNLEIGSGSFIEGFEEGLVGHTVGEKVDLNLTFPEGYYNQEMAGAEVVFHVTINAIRTKNMPEMTDEVVAGFGEEFTTVEEYRKSIRDALAESCEEVMSDNKDTDLWAAIMDGSKVSAPPQSLVDQYKQEIEANVEMYAQMYGMDKETFISQGMGYDTETYDAEVSEGAVSAAEEELVVRAIAKKAEIQVGDDELKSRAESEYADYGYESAEDFLEQVGEDDYRIFILREKVNEYLDGAIKFVDGEEINISEYYNNGMEIIETEDGEDSVSDDSAEVTDETSGDASEGEAKDADGDTEATEETPDEDSEEE